MSKRTKRVISQVESSIFNFTQWIGSIGSIALHTLIFISAFLSILFGARADLVLLVLTTLVSLEAIYLAIFIQMSVNRNTESLAIVEEDIDEIQEDVEEIERDIDEMEKDIDEIQEDVEEIEEDDAKTSQHSEATHEALTSILENLQRLTHEVEELKKQKKI